jgi:hypothetical protein
MNHGGRAVSVDVDAATTLLVVFGRQASIPK